MCGLTHTTTNALLTCTTSKLSKASSASASIRFGRVNVRRSVAKLNCGFRVSWRQHKFHQKFGNLPSFQRDHQSIKLPLVLALQVYTTHALATLRRAQFEKGSSTFASECLHQHEIIIFCIQLGVKIHYLKIV